MNLINSIQSAGYRRLINLAKREISCSFKMHTDSGVFLAWNMTDLSVFWADVPLAHES